MSIKSRLNGEIVELSYALIYFYNLRILAPWRSLSWFLWMQWCHQRINLWTSHLLTTYLCSIWHVRTILQYVIRPLKLLNTRDPRNWINYENYISSWLLNLMANVLLCLSVTYHASMAIFLASTNWEALRCEYSSLPLISYVETFYSSINKDSAQ